MSLVGGAIGAGVSDGQRVVPGMIPALDKGLMMFPFLLPADFPPLFKSPGRPVSRILSLPG